GEARRCFERHQAAVGGRRDLSRTRQPPASRQPVAGGATQTVCSLTAAPGRRHERASARVASDRLNDLANPVLRANQYYCLGGQLLRRASPPSGEIAPDDFGRVCTRFDPERAPEKIYAPAGITRRITRVSAELRRAEVPRSAPP